MSSCLVAYVAVHSAAVRSYLGLSDLNMLATSASCGSSGSGADNKACKETKAVLMVNAGLHLSFNMSRQMAPVWDETFGCHMRVSNFILGGSKGYCLGSNTAETKVKRTEKKNNGGKVMGKR